jgi:hypothetical protein
MAFETLKITTLTPIPFMPFEIQYLKMDQIDEDEMVDAIRKHIQLTHTDPQTIVDPTWFAFDLSSIKKRDDDYIRTYLQSYAESECLDIKWEATLDFLHRPQGHDYHRHPWYVFYMQEV